MPTLHDNEVRLRDQLAGPTEHEIDALIPDLTDVDIHEHIPELREAAALPRAATRVRWLGWLAAVVLVLVAGAVAVLVMTRGDGGQQLPEDGPWSNSLTVPAKGPKPWDAPWSNSLNLITPVRVAVPAPAAPLDLPGRPTLDLPGPRDWTPADLPGSNSLNAIAVDVLELSAAEDAVRPPVDGAPTATSGPGSNSLNLIDG